MTGDVVLSKGGIGLVGLGRLLARMDPSALRPRGPRLTGTAWRVILRSCVAEGRT